MLNIDEILEKHGEQMWGEYPYSVHLENVAQIAEKVNSMYDYKRLDYNTVKLAAYSHDLVEDTDTKDNELDERIRDSVILVSRNRSQDENMPYQDYIVKIANSGDRLAILIKLADALVNYLLSEKNDSSIIARYKKSVPVLFRAFTGKEWNFDNNWRNYFSLNLPY